eukprot:271140_1
MMWSLKLTEENHCANCNGVMKFRKMGSGGRIYYGEFVYDKHKCVICNNIFCKGCSIKGCNDGDKKKEYCQKCSEKIEINKLITTISDALQYLNDNGIEP